MKAWIRRGAACQLLAMLSLACSAAEGTPSPAQSSETFYFQLVTGSESDIAPAPDAKLIGPKLRKKLERVFRWKNYWEIKRGEFKVEEGKPAKVDVSQQRRLEVSFVDGNGLEVRMFKDSRLVRKTREKRGLSFMLMGGDDGKRQSWFIILRRDKPSTVQ
jgi:hypothetical protein